MPEDLTQFKCALSSVCEDIQDIVEMFGGSYGQFCDLNYTTFAIVFIPGISTEETVTGSPYHVVDEPTASHLVGAAQNAPEAFDLVKEICARNVLEGAPLPPAFRRFVSLEIRGTFNSSRRPGPPERFAEKWILYESATWARDAFGLTLTRNEVSPPVSGCDVAAEAARSFGSDVNFEAVRDLCTKKKNLGFRQRADSLSNFVKDLYLEKLGLLTPALRLGPFREMGRMRSNQ